MKSTVESSSRFPCLSLIAALALVVGLLQAGAVFAAQSASGAPEKKAPKGKATFAPKSLAFGRVQAGTTSQKSVNLANVSAVAIDITKITATGAGFSAAQNCLGTLPASNGTCEVVVTFAPATANSAKGTKGTKVTGTLTITDNASNSPQKVTLSGTKFGPVVIPTPTPTPTLTPPPTATAAPTPTAPVTVTPAPSATGSVAATPIVTSTPVPTPNIVLGQNFDGLGQNAFGFTDAASPPNPAGAVGATQFVQWVNGSFAVFNKATGSLLAGPSPGNSLWSSLGGACASSNSGQPNVEYDRLAARWVLAQPVLNGSSVYCIAVSESSDATGPYYQYAPSLTALSAPPSSAKLGVWPDAYYASFNTSVGAYACAFDRNSMLTGATPAAPICFPAGPAYGNLLPADLDGATPPATGEPDFFVSLGASALNLWEFHVDFGTPANSTFTGPASISVPAFTEVCGTGGPCIPQSQTSQTLNSLGGQLMSRAPYRNFGNHESLVVNQSVQPTNGIAGIQWYELRGLSSGPSVFQQGTYAPDPNARWMGSAGMDGQGDIAAAYSVSSANMHPALSLAARASSDPAGTLQAENNLMSGTGSQTSTTLWGAESSLNIDPIDDCTLWFTGEYLRANGTDWNTRIGSFALPACPSSNPAIQITSMPPFGEVGSLQGTVSNVPPANYPNYQVAVLLFVPGLGWYSKPFCSPLFTPINSDGTWSTDVVTGGVDTTATKYVAYLVPQGANVGCDLAIDGLPLDLETQAVARWYVTRANPNVPTVAFSGQSWDVTANSVPIYPGPCVFSANNVSVDSQGALHLAITNNNGTWNCSQVVSSQTYGYGTYTFQLSSDVSDLDPNAVVGLFTFSEDPAYAGAFSPWVYNPPGSGASHGELAFEFSRFGVAEAANNAQFTVAPFASPFQMPSGLMSSTHMIQWLPTGISFTSIQPSGTIAQYTYPGVVPPPVDNGGWPGLVPSPQGVRLNAWLYAGAPPSNGQPVEVVVNSFNFVPLPSQTPTPTPTPSPTQSATPMPTGTPTLTPTQIPTPGPAVAASSASDAPEKKVARGKLTFAPTLLSFGRVQAGTTSQKSVSLANVSAVAIDITKIAATGAGFSAAQTCLGDLAASGGVCQVVVTFAPATANSAKGTKVTGTLTITDNASNSPQKVALSGTKFGPVVTPTPTPLGAPTTPTPTPTPAPGPTSTPSISVSGLTQGPNCTVSGSVTGVNPPQNFKVVVYAQTNEYYVQPCVSAPLTPISSSATWSTPSHSGIIYALLVAPSYKSPPAMTTSLPAVDGVNVLAETPSAGTLNGCYVAACP